MKLTLKFVINWCVFESASSSISKTFENRGSGRTPATGALSRAGSIALQQLIRRQPGHS